MKIITYIYVFALYILCSPGFFFKSKMNITNYIVHGVIFKCVLYFNFGLVNGSMESFEQATLSMNGIGNLVDLIDTHKQQQQTNIDIQNEIKGAEDASAKCWTALGKTQKDIETLRIQLDSYNGAPQTIEKLNATVIEYKDQLLTLQRQMEAYNGDKNSLNNLTKQFNTYKDQLDGLQKQVLAFDGTDESLEKLNKQLATMKSKTETLTTELATCKAKTPTLTSNTTTLQNTYNVNQQRINTLRDEVNPLQTTFNNNQATINSLKNEVTPLQTTHNNNQNTISSLEQQINNRSYC